jgi:hypothetical protein
MLWQRDEKGRWAPVACASRSLTDAETRYSRLERDMLGVVFAISRFRQYALGRAVEVLTDHKPFDEVPPLLQRWLISLMPYQITLTHVPGRHPGYVPTHYHGAISCKEPHTRRSQLNGRTR